MKILTLISSKSAIDKGTAYLIDLVPTFYESGAHYPEN